MERTMYMINYFRILVGMYLQQRLIMILFFNGFRRFTHNRFPRRKYGRNQSRDKNQNNHQP